MAQQVFFNFEDYFGATGPEDGSTVHVIEEITTSGPWKRIKFFQIQ